MKRRNLEAERVAIGRELSDIKVLLLDAMILNDDTPQERRAQTLKIKVAARRLSGLHLSILCGKERSR